MKKYQHNLSFSEYYFSYVLLTYKKAILYSIITLIISELILTILHMYFSPTINILFTIVLVNIILIPSIVLFFFTLCFIIFPFSLFLGHKVMPIESKDYQIIIKENFLEMKYYWPSLFPSKEKTGYFNKIVDRKTIINKIKYENIDAIDIIRRDEAKKHGVFYFPGISNKKSMIRIILKKDIQFQNYVLEPDIKKKYKKKDNNIKTILLDIDNKYHESFIKNVKRMITNR